MALGDFRCRAAAGSCSAEESCGVDCIAFVRRGVFERRIGSERSLGVANQALFYPRNVAHRTRHPVGGGDECTVLSIESALLEEIRASVSGGVLRAPTLPTEGRPMVDSLHVAHWRALRRCASPTTDPIEAHERMLSLASGAVRALTGAAPARSERARPETRRAHRDLAHDAALLMASACCEPWTLQRLATEAHSSPYHLARVFHREMGAPIHRWLLRLRLREALSRLTAGADDLTVVALDVGFASRGHLSDAFRASFGASPSALRRELRAERIPVK